MEGDLMDDNAKLRASIARMEETFNQFAVRLRQLLPPEAAQQVWDEVAGQRYRQFRAEVECLADAGIATRAPLH
jgi:hypothetical protein